MIISPHAQGSVDWSIARAGIPTASEFGNILTDKMEPRTGEMVKSYVAKKLAEKWLGGPLAEFNSFDMEQGRVLEDEAIPRFSFDHGVEVKRVGLITTDDGRVGCSPDGILPLGGLECKCPRVETHIKYLLRGGLPAEYCPQIFGCLYVTGFPVWTFVSYSRRLPVFELVVKADEKILDNIEEALGSFYDAFDAGWERLCDLNGGAPKRHRPIVNPVAPLQDEIEKLTYLA